MQGTKIQKSTVLQYAAVASFAAVAGAQSLYQTPAASVLATHGQAVPGLPGVVFGGVGGMGDPVLDEQGFIVFRGRFAGPGITALNERALFRGTSVADLALLIQGSDPAPGLPGVTLNTATNQGIGGSPRLSANGLVLFCSSLSGAGVVTTNDSAIFGGPVSSMGVLVREGDTAPTGGSTYTTSFSNLSHQPTGLLSNGRILFQSNLAGGDAGATNNAAWISGVPGALEWVQRKGDTVLGGAVIGALGFISQMNESGQVLHDESLSTTLGTTPATTADDKVLFVWTPGSGNALVVREGDAAPGTVGATISATGGFWNPSTGACTFTSSGQTILNTELLNGDVVAGVNDRAIYVGGAGTLTLAMRRGDPAPGTDTVFDVVNTASMGLNNSGRIAFQSSLIGGSSTPTSDTSIWAGTPGSLVLVAREGDFAPGIPGATLGNLSSLPMKLNELGQVLFQASIIGGAGPSAQYAWDPNLGLTLVVASNDSITIAPGDVRIASTWGGIQFNNGDGSPLSMAPSGTFVQTLNFMDGTAAIMVARMPGQPFTSYCFGDGSGTACPCGNVGAPGNGCANSVVAGGANIAASGTASLAGDTIVLTGSGMPINSALYFQGTQRTNGGAGAVFGDGLRCAGGTTIRLATKLNVAGASQYPEPGDLSVSVRGLVTTPGTRTYQVWYRNSAAFCTSDTYNLSNGLEIFWSL